MPGVLPDDPQQPGNPASKSGINYSDIGGDVGVSSDNFYYFNGINVTDPVSGHVRREPEHRDHPGAEGPDRRHPGRVRRHARPALERHHQVGQQRASTARSTTSSRTTASSPRTRTRPTRSSRRSTPPFTIGGPIVRDKAWFFGSYRRVEREDDVTTLDTQQFMRTVKNEQDQGYVKGTWTPTRSDTRQLHVPERSDGHQRPPRSQPHQRPRPRRASRAATTGRLNYSRLQGTGADRRGVQQAQRRGHRTSSAIREQSNTVIYRVDRRRAR